MTGKKRAIVLLSGGLDSATTLAIARKEGFSCYAMTFQYGQRHTVEIASAEKVAASLDVVEHRIIDIDLKQFGGSALTDNELQVPKGRERFDEGVPLTYVPARNLIFLSYALAWAEVLKTFDIFIGVNVTDYSGYPDCRAEFINAFQEVANLATAAAVQCKGEYKIHTPLIEMSKAEIIRKGVELGVVFSLTHSCYDPDKAGRACGRCDSCQIRLKGFAEAGLTDSIKYTE